VNIGLLIRVLKGSICCRLEVEGGVIFSVSSRYLPLEVKETDRGGEVGVFYKNTSFFLHVCKKNCNFAS
jgi:hypothetical protein